MKTIENLINDLEFLDSELNNNQEIGPRFYFKKSDFLNIIDRTFKLIKTDFENENKYDFFLKFMTKSETTIIIKEIESSFVENHLEMKYMLTMGDLFLGIIRKLK